MKIGEQSNKKTVNHTYNTAETRNFVIPIEMNQPIFLRLFRDQAADHSRSHASPGLFSL